MEAKIHDGVDWPIKQEVLAVLLGLSWGEN